MRPWAFLPFVLFFTVSTLNAQNKEVDSLIRELSNIKEDTNKVRVLNVLSEKAGWGVGKYNDALTYAENALGLAKKLNYKKGMANAYINKGVIYANQGNYSEAFKCYSACLKIKQETGDKKGTANAYNNIGLLYMYQSNYAEALNYHFASLKIREAIGDKYGMSFSYTNIGRIYSNQGNYSEALKNHYASLKICEEIGDTEGTSYSYGNIGIVYYCQDNYSEALKNYFASLKIQEEFGNKQVISNFYGNIGLVYMEQGNYTEALKYDLACLKLKEEMDNKKGASDAYGNIGVVYFKQRNFSEALKNQFVSLKIKEEIGDKTGIANTYNNIGDVYLHQGNYSEALKYNLASLKIKEEIGDKRGISNSYSNIGLIRSSQGNYPEALNYYLASLKIKEEIGEKAGIKVCSENLTKIFIHLKQSDSAAFYLSMLKNITYLLINTNYFTLTEHEKGLYFETLEKDFGLYHDFVLKYHKQYPGLSDTAYNITLQTKGLALQSSTAMRSDIQQSGDTALINRYEEWLALKRQISKGNLNTDSLENIAATMERTLVQQSTAFSNFDKMRKLDWKQVQKALKSNEAAIEFVNFKNQLDTTKTNEVVYAAYLIKKKSQHPQIIRLCTETELIAILGNTQDNNLSFINKVYGTRSKAQTALYQKIWQPLEKDLEGITSIYYSPSGLLHKISFAALSKADNIFLCDAYHLNRQASTGQQIFSGNHPLSGKENYTLVGGVQYSSSLSKHEIWNYLPGTLNETQNITHLLQTKKQKVINYTAEQASEETLKQKISTANVLHIATHGFFYPDPEEVQKETNSVSIKTDTVLFRGNHYAEWSFVKNRNPLMRSGIVLAGANDVWNKEEFGNQEDGVLTALEVSNLDMQHTKLVVLSACETGLGDIKGSEGVFGLQRSFKMAGAENLIISLWQVSDKETSEFMQLFYGNLLKTKDIKTAFVQAQNSMRKKYDPYFWAAFVLVE